MITKHLVRKTAVLLVMAVAAATAGTAEAHHSIRKASAGEGTGLSSSPDAGVKKTVPQPKSGS